MTTRSVNFANMIVTEYDDADIDDPATEVLSKSAIDTNIDAKIATHVGLSDPHTQYKKESELGTIVSQNLGATGTFTTVDSKTVTVTNGIIVSIV
mgnify:CR=1 FL=1